MAEDELAVVGTGGTTCSTASVIPMADAKDEVNLSDSLTLIRRQLEYFQATVEDVEARKKKGGKYQTLHVGQVGFRCIHCAHRPDKERSKGAVSFPASTGLIYQAVRNWQRYHFMKCPDISEEIKAELKSFKRAHSGKDIERYCIDSCHRKGLVDGRICSESSESEVILLKNTANAGADTSPTNKLEDKLNRRLTEEKKCPSLSELDLFGDPSDIDTLLGIDSAAAGADVSGSGLYAGGHGSSDTFNFSFTGSGCLLLGDNVAEDTTEDGYVEESTKKRAAETAGISDEPGTSNEPVEKIADLQDTEEDFEPIPVDYTVIPSNQAPFDRATLNECIILQQVHDACKLVEAACELNPDYLVKNGDSQSGQLALLGKHLYQHFSGVSPNDGPPSTTVALPPSADDTNSTQRPKRGRCITDGQSLTPLTGIGIPYAISNLVQQLLCYSGGTDNNVNQFFGQEQQYSSMKDVLDELQLMIREPDRYLFGEGLPQTGTLNLVEGRLYGREHEMSTLDKAFQGLKASGTCSMLCITGDSGTGKSALAMQIRDPLQRIGGFFLSEKFDELQQVKQVPVVFSALDTLCSEIVHRGGPILQATKARLESSLGSEMDVLLSTIPSLSAIVGPADGPMKDLTGQSAFNRLLFCVRQLVKCASRKDHPIILLIDDLQWADEFSLALIEAIASDDDISSFLLIACYRDGEVAGGHPLLKTIHSIKSSNANVFQEIRVENIDRSSVTSLVSDTLQITPSKARPLANLIHSKTGGQPLFVTQFVKSLYEEGLLRYSPSNRQWEWDADTISEKTVADTVAKIMMSKMLRYPEEVLMSLKLAACLGHEFDTKTLDLLGPEDSDHSRGPTMTDNLNIAVLDGLLIKSRSSESTVYKFSHDQIRLAAFSLICVDEQAALHLQIARHLLSKTNAGDVDSMLFIIVNQFGRGLSLISDRSEKTQVARLYLRAADKAISFFAYTAAAMFSAQGISLLDEDHWRTDYQLSVGLHSTNAEANNVGGELEQVEANANVIFAKAQTFEEKLPTYLSLVQAIGSRGLLMKATAIGLEVLQKLDIVLPANPDRDTALMAIDQTREMLESIPTEAFFSRVMHDENTLFALKMLSLLYRYTSMNRRELMAIIACRMVQLTVEHGVCSNSIIALSAYAYLLANTGRLALGQKYKQLALPLIDRFKAQEAIPLVYINCFEKMIQGDPVQASFSQLEAAWQIAQQYGNREEMFYLMNREIASRFYFGHSLQSLETTTRSHIREMNKTKEMNYISITIISTKLLLQAILNLMDPSCQDPCTLTGEMTDQDAIFTIAQERKYFSLIMQITRLRVYLAYLFRKYDLAASLLEGVLAQLSKGPFLPNGVVVSSTFHFGLVALQMARANDAEKWLSTATGCMDKMKAWSEASPWNYGHMMQLLEAEYAYNLGDHEKANSAFEKAIRFANEHKFMHDEALCLERAALYYADTCGSTSDLSTGLMTEARELYMKWGALGKAAAM